MKYNSSNDRGQQDHRCKVSDSNVNQMQICQKDDKDQELLLCDSCNEAYHVSCLNGLIESIPTVRS